LRRTHPLTISVEADDQLGLTLDQEHALLRIAQEAVHNIVKHAPGASARVRLQRRHADVVLTVSDNGPGFDPSARSRTESTMGMSSMYARAGEIGARITVRSSPGTGATVTVHVPAATGA